MISELKERLTAVEGEIEELKKEPPTNPLHLLQVHF